MTFHYLQVAVVEVRPQSLPQEARHSAWEVTQVEACAFRLTAPGLPALNRPQAESHGRGTFLGLVDCSTRFGRLVHSRNTSRTSPWCFPLLRASIHKTLQLFPCRRPIRARLM